MDQIEAFAGMYMFVLKDPQPASPSDPNPFGPAARVSHDKAAIVLRDTENIDPEGILHELLHIQRYWVEGAPQIMPVPGDKSDDHWSVTSFIDNAIEHTVIVPREADYGFSTDAHWNETERKNWTRYPWPEIANDFARRKNCLVGWLASDLVSDSTIKELMAAGLRTEGLFAEAEKVSKACGEFHAFKQG